MHFSSSLGAVVALAPFFTLTIADNAPLPVIPIARLPSISFENIVIHQTGYILTTTTRPSASLYKIDPLQIHAPQQLIAFQAVQSATGITASPLDPDTFYVAAGNFSLQNPRATVPDSYRLLRVRLHCDPPEVSVAAHLPDAALPNGIAVTAAGTHVLVADSFAGLIWTVDLASGDVRVALNESSTAGPDASGPGITGANGIKIWHQYLYWSNTGRSTLYRVAIDEGGMRVPGSTVETVAAGVSCDDFVVADDGVLYVAGPLGVLTRIEVDGAKSVVAGGQQNASTSSGKSVLGGPSAAAFGRLEMDAGSLYVTTNGGIPPHQTNGTEGVSRVDVFRL